MKTKILWFCWALTSVFSLYTLFTPTMGWDFNIVCAAWNAHLDGINPYLVENLRPYGNNHLNFAYPIHSLIFIAPFCSLNSFLDIPHISLLFQLFSFALSGILFWNSIKTLFPQDKEKHLYVTMFFFTSFSSLAWCVRTGNIAPLELVFLSLIFWIVSKNKFQKAIVVIAALLASLKLSAIVFFSLFIFKPDRKWQQGLLSGITASLALAGLFSLVYAYDTDLLLSFWKGATGNLPNQHSAAHELSLSVNHPSFLYLLRDLSKILTGSVVPGYALWPLTLLVSLYIYFLYQKKSVDLHTALVSCGLLLLLAQPRLKPYTFVYASFFGSLALLHPGVRGRAFWTLFGIGTLLPSISVFNPSYRGIDVWPALRVSFQPISVLIFIVYFWISSRRTQNGKSASDE